MYTRASIYDNHNPPLQPRAPFPEPGWPGQTTREPDATICKSPGRLCSALTRQSRPPGIVEVLAYKVLYSIAAVSLPEVKTNARGSLS